MTHLKPAADTYLRHIPGFVATDQADTMLHLLQACIPWSSFAPSPNSRKVCRWQLGMSDADSIIHDLQHKLERTENVTVQGTFLNLYQDGKDYCPYHRDLYGTDVYTISLGATRDLLVKPDGSGDTRKITLKSGDLYYMDEKLHKNHKQQHTKTRRSFQTTDQHSILRIIDCINGLEYVLVPKVPRVA